ncbi:MAG: hypothetical protein K0Q74_919, partial [Gammaproteobacteria bacterium]|nr:hypothetical protein [Gammaproteobacteria bacterium]
KALQSAAGNKVSVRVNTNLAKKMGLQNASVVRVAQKGHGLTLPLVIDDRIADGFVYVPAGVAETAGFGEILGEIEVSA